MNLHIESTLTTYYYFDNYEKNALKIAINIADSLYKNDISMEGEVWSFTPKDFKNLAEQLNEILNLHGVENDSETNKDFSCPTYVRILSDVYKEKKEEEEEHEED